jgi:hypothetical protein
LIGAVDESGGGGKGHQGVHVGLFVFEFFVCVDVEISAAEEDHRQREEALDEAFVGDLVHEEHGEGEDGEGAEGG